MKTTTLAGAFAAALLALAASWAQDLPDFGSSLEDAGARLGLTDAQADQLRPIFEAWFEAQAAILKEHGIGDGAEDGEATGEAVGGVGIAEFQALQRALGDSDAEFEAQVAAVLSDTQMDELDALREEGRVRVQETILARRVEEIGERIGLGEEQLGPFRAIYAEHVESQIAILDRHGVQVGGGGRTRLRTLVALRRDMQAADDATLGRLASLLSDGQLAEYRTIQEEQRERNRESIR